MHQGRLIQPDPSCIMYYTYYIILCIIFRIILRYHFRTIQLKFSRIIHNTQYNTYCVLIRIMYYPTLAMRERLAEKQALYASLDERAPCGLADRIGNIRHTAYSPRLSQNYVHVRRLRG